MFSDACGFFCGFLLSDCRLWERCVFRFLWSDRSGWLFLEWGIGFLRRGPSFVGMTILGGCFGMRWLVLTQRSLLRRDDKVWVGGGLTNLANTHHYFVLPRYEESLR